MAASHFKTGDVVTESGIYRVVHSVHRLPHSVTICKDEIFPRCAKCSDSVTYELVRAVDCPFSYEPMHVYELQPTNDSEEEIPA